MRFLLVLVLVLVGCQRDWELPQVRQDACADDSACNWGLCVNGKCEPLDCRDDTHCQFGVCVNGRCDEGRCGPTLACRTGLCENGLCVGCLEDDHCFGSQFCNNGGIAGVFGACLGSDNLGPAVVGDPTQLTALENLESTWAWVEANHGPADLISIIGSGFDASGRLDLSVTNNTIDYTFLVRGRTETTSLRFLKDTGLNAGYHLDGLSTPVGSPIPEAVWRTFVDSPVLASGFDVQAGCDTWTGDTLDSLSIWDITPLDLHASLQTQHGDSGFADPTTGTFDPTFLNCP